MKQRKLHILGLSLLSIFFLGSCCPGPWPWCPSPPPQPVTFNFQPGSISRLCPAHIGGDREFDGHGPNVTASAILSVRNDTEIWVKIYLHEKETKSDWTEAEGTWDRKLWAAPSGKRIVSIDSDMASNASYVDTDHSLDSPVVTGGNLVSKFEIMGDTGGNDVGNCTADDAYITVYFNEVKGHMQNL